MIRDVKALLYDVYTDEFGLLPTNVSIKPVHIANGLGRALAGANYKSDALSQFLRRTVKDQKAQVQRERHSNGNILASYPLAFVGRDGADVDQDKLSTLRTLAEGVLATDGAVFSDSAMSSYTLSNDRLLSRDISDMRCGAFLASLLTAGRDGDAAEHIRFLLKSDQDPWSTLALPMSQYAELLPLSPGTEEALRTTHSSMRIDVDGVLESRTLRILRSSIDRLARFDHGHGSKLNSLRRMVTFSCFAIHVHLISRLEAVYAGKPQPPIVLDMFDGKRTSIRNASRASVRAAGDSLEALVTRRFRERVSQIAVAADPEEIITGIADAKVRALVERGYEAYGHGGNATPDEALSEALWQAAMTVANHPVEFLTELGRRAGYLVPWSNKGQGGKLQKRYGLTTEFIETLVAATVDPDEPLDFPEFLDRLRSYYGIVAGQRTDDHIIRRNNINDGQFGTPTSVSEEDLRLNVEAFRRAVLEAGYAKAYADGQTVVTTNPESLAIL
ncbi:hypothetical protein ABT346_20030 [Micromonospora peucetia]|uniref:hypothetical protein n=1 Tax=Micromonospora peucetia TaxID=47871 RepID=UPI0033295CDD